MFGKNGFKIFLKMSALLALSSASVLADRSSVNSCSTTPSGLCDGESANIFWDGDNQDMAFYFVASLSPTTEDGKKAVSDLKFDKSTLPTWKAEGPMMRVDDDGVHQMNHLTLTGAQINQACTDLPALQKGCGLSIEFFHDTISLDGKTVTQSFGKVQLDEDHLVSGFSDFKVATFDQIYLVGYQLDSIFSPQAMSNFSAVDQELASQLGQSLLVFLSRE